MIEENEINCIYNKIGETINLLYDYNRVGSYMSDYLSEEEYWSILTEQKAQIELAFDV